MLLIVSDKIPFFQVYINGVICGIKNHCIKLKKKRKRKKERKIKY